MNYLTCIGMTYSTKNKLEKEVADHFKSLDRKIVKGHELDMFKANLNWDIYNLNQKHARCLPVKVDFEPGRSGSKDIHVRWNNFPNTNGRELLRFSLLKIADNEEI